MNPREPLQTTIQLTQSELARVRGEVASRIDRLVLYARSRCSAPEDVVQEALVDLVKLSALPDDIGAWMYQAVRWRAANHRRSEKRHNDKLVAHSLQGGDWFTSPKGDSSGSDIDSDELQVAVKLLPEPEQEIIVLKIWGELPLTEIAKQLGISKSTAHRKYWAAIEQLKQQLSPTTDEEYRSTRAACNDKRWHQSSAQRTGDH